MNVSKLDIFVDKLDSLSDKPIKKIYNMTKESYLNKNNELDKTDLVYNEIIYYYLTDAIEGCEFTVIVQQYQEELEHLKDVIGFEGSRTVISELSKKAQNINIEIATKKKNEDEKTKSDLNRFVLMCFSFQDNRYIDLLVEHFVVKEKIEPDLLIQNINKRIMKSEDKILRAKSTND